MGEFNPRHKRTNQARMPEAYMKKSEKEKEEEKYNLLAHMQSFMTGTAKESKELEVEFKH